MDCTRASDLMMSYFDQDIHSSDKEKLILHMKRCDSCMEEFNALEEAIEGVVQLKDYFAPEFFEIEVMKGIDIHRYKKKTKRNPYGAIAIFAVFAAGTVLGIFFYLRFGTVDFKETYSYVISATKLFSVSSFLTNIDELISSIAILWIQFIKEMPLYIKSIVGVYFAILAVLGTLFIGIQLILMKLTTGENLRGGNLNEEY